MKQKCDLRIALRRNGIMSLKRPAAGEESCQNPKFKRHPHIGNAAVQF